MRIAIVLLIILNFIWLEAYLNIYSKYKSKCTECDAVTILRTAEIYRLRKDIKHKDRAIVRYKKRNAKFRHTCDEQSRRLEDLRDELLTEKNVAWWYKNWYTVMQNERDAYLYCLRQIQEEVTNAKEE